MTLEERNPFEVLYNLVYSIVNEITDINDVRRNSTNPKAKTWWFPSWPEANDENYPRGSIGFDRVETITQGASNYINDTYVDNKQTNTCYGDILAISVTLGIHIKKDQTHKIPDFQGNDSWSKNQRQADWLADRVKKKIRQHYDDFAQAYMPIEGEIEVIPAYEDNTFLFSAEVRLKVHSLDVWETKYAEAQLINDITITETVDRTDC